MGNACEMLETRAMLSISAGSLDDSFSAPHGTITTNVSGFDDQGFTVAYNATTGDTLVAGPSNNMVAVAAYKADGSLELTPKMSTSTSPSRSWGLRPG
jgi:hypothetical protein